MKNLILLTFIITTGFSIFSAAEKEVKIQVIECNLYTKCVATR